MRLLALVLDTLKVNDSGTVAYMEVTRSMLKKTGADIAKSEGLINYARAINGVRVAILFKEGLGDKSKVSISFRSKGNGAAVDVNKIASLFGGGGHMRASGCVIKGTLKAVKKKVLAEVDRFMKNSK
jgi:phosphoesterase RecJ-like protein